MNTWGIILLVVGTFNGQPSMATTAFNSPEVCLAYANDFKKHHPEIKVAKCLPDRGTI